MKSTLLNITTALCLLCPSPMLTAQTNTPSSNTMPDTSVGGMGAVFGVSPMGGATLNIPIEVPMGVGGLQPNLSIVYNSQTGNGLCGYGATLAGLSSITRGPKDIYHDNAAKGIKYWTDDAFYLDGVRLELESGTPGQYGTVYVPENDPYTKVITYGSSNSITDNTWFEVQSSDGMIYWYGNSSASRLIYEDGNKTKIQSWNLSFVKQPSGNFINLFYLTDNNCLYPSVIAYGTNLNQSNTLRDTIYFTYESRSDSVPIRFDGQKGSMKKRLSSITGKVNGEIYRKYTLNYNTTGDGTARKFSRLVSVTEENTLGETLPATQLNWSYLPTVSYQSTGMPVANPDVSSVVSFPFSGQVFAAGDLNNDGLADIAGFSNVSISNGHGGYYEKTYLYIYWAKKSSTGITYPSGRLFEMNPSFDMNIFRDRPTGCFYSYYEGGAVSDWNGDGYNELFLPNFEDMANQQNLSFYIRGVKPDGSKLEQQVNCPLYTNGNAVYAINDIDNNGKCDIVVVEKEAYNGSYICTLLTQASNGNLSYAQLNLSMSSSPRRVYLTDMNNNGLKDLLIVCEDNYTVYWNQGGPISTIIYSDSFTTTRNDFDYWRMTAPGDFNGDGLLDFLTTAIGSSSWKIFLNSGDGSFSVNDACTLGLYEQAFTLSDDDKFHCDVLDFDGDGMDDVVITKAMYENVGNGIFDKTHTYWMRSTGTGLVQAYHATSERESDAQSHLFVTADFDGDGRAELVNYGYDCVGGVNADSDPVWRIYKNSNLTVQSGTVISMTGDFGAITSITYSTLADTTVYKRGSNDPYPAPKYTFPLNVVKQTTHSNGAASNSRGVQYSYEGLKVHLQGRGLLGFCRVSNTDLATGIKTESGVSEWNTTYFIPSATYSSTTVDGQTASTINYMDISSRGTNGYYSFPTTTIQTDMDGYSTMTTRTYNITHGYLTNETVKYDGWNMYRSVVYSNFVQTAAGVYLPKRIDREQKHADDMYITFTADTCTYNLTTGAVLERVQNVGTDKPLTTRYTYDTWGNVRSVKQIGSGITECTTYYTFDDTRRFRTRIYTYPESNIIIRTYNLMGDMESEKDSVNASISNTTRCTYDGWGNLIRTDMPDGSFTTCTRGWNNDAGKRYFVLTQGTATPWVKTWYDNCGREVRTESIGPKGVNILKSTSYNTKGQVQTRTETEGNLSLTYSYQYDDRGRVTQETAPGSNVRTYTYSANGSRKTVAVNDNNLTTTTTVYDAWGNVKSVANTASGTVTNTYDSNGKIYKTETGGVEWEFWYDNRGNRIAMEDPDAGVTEYVYDALGREIQRTDARGVVFVTNYDYLGRVTQRKAGSSTINYTYGSSETGQMHLISESNGTWTKSYTYDALGRVTGETMSKGNIISKSREYNYGSNGLLISRTMPGGKTVQYTYDAYGNTTGVDFEFGTIAWSLTGYNGLRTTSDIVLDNYTYPFKKTIVLDQYGNLDSLRITQATQYGGITYQNEKYIFDPIRGNLMQRQGVYDVTSIRYSYDSTDRLLTATDTYNNQLMAVTYAANGNITSKTGIGSYTYGSTSKPHAVTEVDNTDGSIGHSYQEVFYNSWGKMYKVQQTDATGLYTYNVIYGPDLQRVESWLDRNQQTEYEKFYWDDYEEKTTGSLTTRYWYINGPDGLIGIYIEEQTPSGTVSMSTLAITDHLGSIEELCGNNNGHFYGARYDEWGNREKIFSFYLSDDIDRGFCGHEHIEELGLINMNGRMYEPLLGRFLSPDPYVQAPTDPQNFNRYSYCLNNPLKYTDPSGNFLTALAGMFCPALLPIAIGMDIGWMSGAHKSYYYPDISKFDGACRGAISGAIGGALSYVGGGPLVCNVLWGSTQGAITGAIDAKLWGEDVGAAALYGAIMGGVFASFSSLHEAALNKYEGYGFKTNEGVMRSLLKKRKYGQAIDYFRLKNDMLYGNDGEYIVMEYDPRYKGAAWGYTSEGTGYCSIYKSATKNLRRFKATIVHEYAHAKIDRYINSEGFYDWKYKPESTLDDGVLNLYDGAGYKGDGVCGYGNEILNAGRVHLSIGYFFNFHNNDLFPVWLLKRGWWEWYCLLPTRYNWGVNIRPY